MLFSAVGVLLHLSNASCVGVDVLTPQMLSQETGWFDRETNRLGKLTTKLSLDSNSIQKNVTNINTHTHTHTHSLSLSLEPNLIPFIRQITATWPAILGLIRFVLAALDRCTEAGPDNERVSAGAAQSALRWALATPTGPFVALRRLFFSLLTLRNSPMLGSAFAARSFYLSFSV